MVRRLRITRFEPWSRKTPHAAEQLSPWATTAEPLGPRPPSCATRDATAVRSLRSATGEQPLPTARGARAQQQRPVPFKLKLKNSALPMQAVCVPSLVGELRSHKPHSRVKNQRETSLWTEPGRQQPPPQVSPPCGPLSQLILGEGTGSVLARCSPSPPATQG